MNDYKPLEDYGLIGNLETCALVSNDGSIDWCCLPRLNSSSVFAAILDAERGGRFSIHPSGAFESQQRYMERTNVLQTTFHTDSGTATVTDFMPRSDDGGDQPKVRALYRKVTCTNGTVPLDIKFSPRFDYARAETTLESIADGVLATGAARHVSLSSPVALDIGDRNAHASYPLNEYDTHWFVLRYGMRAPTDQASCEGLLTDTVEFWRDWAQLGEDFKERFEGYYDTVIRSGLVLKLLTYQGTGGITAAPTTSLPETIGGVRNWDYRYNWIRDGAFTVRAYSNLGHIDEAQTYLDEFLNLSRSVHPSEMQPIYGLQHDPTYEEEELDHLSGYRDSAPVRIGNGAASQRQLGMYGELILGIDQLARLDEEIANDDWNAIYGIVEYVRDIWDEPDAGIWEMRSGPKQFVHSKAMCWVALDTAIKIANEHDFDAPLTDWREDREEIKETIIECGFDEDQNSFVQAFDDDQLDASLLLIPLTGFLPFDDPRIEGTIDAICNELTTDDGLVYRYEHDELPGDEGAFFLCSFWLVDCLICLGRTERAREIYENLLEYSSPLGLVAEEIAPDTGELLGNFPQAFSHIGLINSAQYLHEAEQETSVEPFGAHSG